MFQYRFLPFSSSTHPQPSHPFTHKMIKFAFHVIVSKVTKLEEPTFIQAGDSNFLLIFTLLWSHFYLVSMLVCVTNRVQKWFMSLPVISHQRFSTSSQLLSLTVPCLFLEHSGEIQLSCHHQVYGEVRRRWIKLPVKIGEDGYEIGGVESIFPWCQWNA